MRKDILIVFLKLTLQASAMNLSVTCPNRYHCRQASTAGDGFKLFYVSTTFRQNVVLNVTPMATTSINSRENCLITCLKNQPCWSVNYEQSQTIMNTSCELLQANEYTNISMLTPRKGWNHHSIETQCMSSPCKNNGSCIPNLENGAFACRCMWPWRGRLCGIYRGVLERAQGFWNFDTNTKNVGYNLTFTMTLGTGGKIFYVPDLQKAVVFCHRNDLQCIWLQVMPAWLKMNGTGADQLCPNGFTISFWIKHLINATTLEIFTNQHPANNGLNLILRNHNLNTRTIDWNAEVRSKTGIWNCNILRGPHALLWTHYALVFYPNNQGVACYLNGIAYETNSNKGVGTGQEAGDLVLGGRYGVPTKSIFYMNDLGIWNEALSAEDIQYLLKDGQGN